MYILSQCSHKDNFGKTVLCSIMYFIDFNYYELYGKLLTNETYIKSKRGIRPKHFRQVSGELIASRQLFFRKEPYYNRIIYKYYPLIIPDAKFKPDELEIIHSSIRKLSNSNANTIMKYAIRDPPITIANLGEEIDFRYVFSRDREYSILKSNPKMIALKRL
jgi:hypothetical protein